jgi:hypothetical protein
VLWTAGEQYYADSVLDEIAHFRYYFPPHRRMYRGDCEGLDTYAICVKNIDILGIDARRVVLLDNNVNSFMVQTILATLHDGTRFHVMTNGIHINDFTIPAIMCGHTEVFINENRFLVEVRFRFVEYLLIFKQILTGLANTAVDDVRPWLIQYQARYGYRRILDDFDDD